MKNNHTIFTDIQQYYAGLCKSLASAQEIISMACLGFVDGFWARQMKSILAKRVAAGVRVRLMVDAFGQRTEDPRRLLSSFNILRELREAGIEVTAFQPKAAGFTIFNRLHAKFYAIDDNTAFLGGANIGDFYTSWSDTNIRIDGSLGCQFHHVFDLISSISTDSIVEFPSHLSSLDVGSDRLLLTIPGRMQDIRQAYMNIIQEAETALFLKAWTFLPDEELMDALCTQAGRGVQVNVLVSDRTRVRIVDLANPIPLQKLACVGVRIYRFTGNYMHSKVIWNDKGRVLIGSANPDPHSITKNFEMCLHINDLYLANQLKEIYLEDIKDLSCQTPQGFQERSFPSRMLTRVCFLLVSQWK